MNFEALYLMENLKRVIKSFEAELIDPKANLKAHLEANRQKIIVIS